MNLPTQATQPTMYFIGVTTGQSSIMKLFPLWAEVLGLDNAIIKGIDIELHAKQEVYREAVGFIKQDVLSLGALVTTHKIDLYEAAADMFDYFDPYATMFGELSSISKKAGKLEGFAKDPISSGLAMDAFVPADYWSEHSGDLFIMGAGGSAIAICSYLLNEKHGTNIPSQLFISDRSLSRLEEIERLVSKMRPELMARFIHLTPESITNDELLHKLKPHSLVINATGLGKDRPGSPLTDDALFPDKSVVWELNYRGELDFLKQARKQQGQQQLQVEDGWIYFIHGWTQVIAEVFHFEITPQQFSEIERISNSLK
ncbi:shikimate dehydrogenase [Paenibacillus psychroresistens]|uniref:Shikimate dehydrogenase n=1 Tax=Paenibacillus psychroresistens TaxID=1778678 RepID=A0A6B8RLS8_9BACL|nr:shikimate dehydrogenase [Paenibacillus psychroresistens]QGQ96386.1 shikimate dehydrogenase [Paenibacillus psychroresistens]